MALKALMKRARIGNGTVGERLGRGRAMSRKSFQSLRHLLQPNWQPTVYEQRLRVRSQDMRTTQRTQITSPRIVMFCGER